MNSKELHKYEIIKQVVNGELTQKDAMYELELSRQQIYRLIIIYKTEGENGFIHKNKGKSNVNKISDDVIKEIENKYLNEYWDYNFTAFYEEISNDYNISFPIMCEYFKRDNIISPQAHKKTFKLYNEKMEDTTAQEQMSEKVMELHKTRLLEQEQAHVRRSSNYLKFGEEVQMDACVKIWYGNDYSYLHLAVDKATKKILFGWFEHEELTRGYFVLLFNIIINYGIPKTVSTDNRSTFSANNAKYNKDKLNLTQFASICNTLGIVLKTSSNPLSKANVERENRTVKGRLSAELRRAGITNIDDANEYLNKKFIPKMNEKFSNEINYKSSLMKSNNYSNGELKLIISEKYERIIDNASAIKYNGKYYIPIDIDNGNSVSYMHKTKCTLIISYDGEYWAEIEGKYYRMKEIKGRELVMRKEKDVPKEEKKEHTKYIPPANHPWRKFKF